MGITHTCISVSSPTKHNCSQVSYKLTKPKDCLYGVQFGIPDNMHANTTDLLATFIRLDRKIPLHSLVSLYQSQATN